MQKKAYYLRKPNDDLVVGPLPEVRIGELVTQGKIDLADEVSEDQTRWIDVRTAFPAEALLRESEPVPETATAAPAIRQTPGRRMCEVCGARMLPKQHRCTECYGDPLSDAARRYKMEVRRRKSARTAAKVLTTPVEAIAKFDAPIRQVCVSPDGSLCLAIIDAGKSADGAKFKSGICLLDLRNGRRIIDERSPGNWASGAAFSQDARRLAIAWYVPGGLFRTRTVVTIADVAGTAAPVNLELGGPMVNSLGFSPDGEFLFAGEPGGRIRVLRCSDGQCARRFKVKGSLVLYSGDGRLAVVSNRKGRVWCWDLAQGRFVREFRKRALLGSRAAGGTNGVAIARDGRYVATCDGFPARQSSSNRKANVWVAVLNGNFLYLPIALLLDKQQDEGNRQSQPHALGPRASLWDVASGEEVLCLDAAQGDHPEGVSCVALAGDHHRMVTGCFDGVLRLWDIDSKRCISRSPSQESGIQHVAVAANGKVVFSTGNSPQLRVWTPRERSAG